MSEVIGSEKKGQLPVGLRRFLQIFTLVGFPLLGFVYFYQFLNPSGLDQKAVPFQTFKAPVLDVSVGPGPNSPYPFEDPITVVNFWATWCAPCVEEFPALLELQRQLEGRGVRVLFVSVDEKWEDVEAFQARFGRVPEGQLFWDPKKEAASRWGSAKFPETYVVTRSGWVVEKIIGLQQWTRPGVMAYFDNLGKKFAR